ncbi:MAG: PilW family protein [Candidatus Endonucleobacter bathymodioli]|uniref:PilW family protein n=1 Tax=Candidatus Endonucleibacter bathymodioli TaxID=539814 RepID=A0AA90NMZ3_9GAMM|nr:PilW family protein [Candidatus Endonucleobacter bathymodioli]
MKTALHTQLDSHRVENNIKQVGLSLVEMMISALLSVVVIQGMFEVFFANLQSSSYSETRAQAQTSAQRALDMLGRDIREAGSGSVRVGVGGYNLYPNESFSGATTRKTNTLLNSCQAHCDGSDSCKGFSWGSGYLSSGTHDGDCRLSYGATLRRGAPAWITYQKVENTLFYRGLCDGEFCTDEGGGNQSDAVAPVLDPGYNSDCTGVYVEGAIVNRYFIDTTAEGEKGLFCKSFNTDGSPRGDGHLMVEGVEQLQVLYGYADGGGRVVTSYREADDIVNWGFVKGVKVGILVGGGNQIGRGVIRNRSYNVLGSTTLSINDKEPRYVYTMTQSLFATKQDNSWRERVYSESGQDEAPDIPEPTPEPPEVPPLDCSDPDTADPSLCPADPSDEIVNLFQEMVDFTCNGGPEPSTPIPAGLDIRCPDVPDPDADPN